MAKKIIKTAAAVGLTAVLTAVGTIKFWDYRNKADSYLTQIAQEKNLPTRDLVVALRQENKPKLKVGREEPKLPNEQTLERKKFNPNETSGQLPDEPALERSLMLQNSKSIIESSDQLPDDSVLETGFWSSIKRKLRGGVSEPVTEAKRKYSIEEMLKTYDAGRKIIVEKMTRQIGRGGDYRCLNEFKAFCLQTCENIKEISEYPENSDKKEGLQKVIEQLEVTIEIIEKTSEQEDKGQLLEAIIREYRHGPPDKDEFIKNLTTKDFYTRRGGTEEWLF